uniref:Uncharacterized protein n=1 Tax=Avena sativa TaxID=4498 RepID=A0ACD5VW93_AVESA
MQREELTLMESQGSKGDPSKAPSGGKGDPSKSPISDGGKGDPNKSPMSDGGKGDPSKTAKPTRLPIRRPPEHATKGRRITLLANHFEVTLKRTDQILYHYDVTLKYEDGKPALGDGLRRKVMKQMFETYASLLAHKVFAYDGENDLGGGVIGCRGFHSSFRPTQNGLSLNVDLSTTMVVTPGPVIDFLLLNQDIRDRNPKRIDWPKAKRALNKLRIKTTHTNAEFEITGLSKNNCNKQMFPLKQGDWQGYRRSGKAESPTYLPLELCHLLPLQRYKKSLSMLQRTKLVEGSRQKPLARMSSLSRVLRDNNYDSEPMLRECGISVAREFMQVEGRVLQAPQLSAGDDRQLYASNGRWNFNKDRFIQPIKVKTWGAVKFSARCDLSDLVRRLIQAGNMKGIQMESCAAVIEERQQMRREPPAKRVEAMFQQIKSSFKQKPEFLLCVLPEKNCDIYGLWKRECLAEHGIVTQCLVPPANIKDQYLTNVLLKINAKLGGLNSLLRNETAHTIPLVSNAPTIIFGMDVSHGSPGSNVPSVAAVVSSLGWPFISKYRASVRTQAPKLEIIDSLFKQDGDDDQGLIKDSLIDFLNNSKGRRPEQIIIFRDGVSESQFNEVLNDELTMIMEVNIRDMQILLSQFWLVTSFYWMQACEFFGSKHFGGKWFPKFTLIVAQKNHHTRFFMPNERNNEVNNVQPGNLHLSYFVSFFYNPMNQASTFPLFLHKLIIFLVCLCVGTVVDKGICHPRNFDFYMCAHAGMIVCSLHISF